MLAVRSHRRLKMGVKFFMASNLIAAAIIALIAEGEAKPPQKILHGSAATKGEFPHMVSIQHDGLHHCGGAIIGPRHILTAAHCFVGKYEPPYTKDITVVTGTINKYSGGETHQVAKVTAHKDFVRGTEARWRNDIAIVTLADSLKFNRYQKAIELASTVITHKVSAELSGWGLVVRGGNSATILQKTDVSVITNDECNKKDGRVFDDQICGFDGKDRGFCNGDSGSPLVYNDRVIGVVSFSPSCGIGYPDVYTRVTSFRKWIDENTK